MEIPITVFTRNSESLVHHLFGGNKTREIILDRAKLHLKEISYQLEKNDYRVEICITMLTSFGAASVSNYLNQKLKLDSAYQIRIGSESHQFFGEKIRESLLVEYSRLHK